MSTRLDVDIARTKKRAVFGVLGLDAFASRVAGHWRAPLAISSPSKAQIKKSRDQGVYRLLLETPLQQWPYRRRKGGVSKSDDTQPCHARNGWSEDRSAFQLISK